MSSGRRRFLAGSVLAIASVSCTVPAVAQNAKDSIDITANSMTIYEKEFRAVFLGKVDAIKSAFGELETLRESFLR